MIISGSPWSWCLLSFLLCLAELFLSLCISSNFGLCPGHSEYYETLGPVNNTPAAYLVAQSCPTLLLSPIQLFLDCSLPGSSAHGISQARILEWVAISFSSVSSLNLGLLHWQADSLSLSHQGKHIITQNFKK